MLSGLIYYINYAKILSFYSYHHKIVKNFVNDIFLVIGSILQTELLKLSDFHKLNNIASLGHNLKSFKFAFGLNFLSLMTFAWTFGKNLICYFSILVSSLYHFYLKLILALQCRMGYVTVLSVSF